MTGACSERPLNVTYLLSLSPFNHILCQESLGSLHQDHFCNGNLTKNSNTKTIECYFCQDGTVTPGALCSMNYDIISICKPAWFPLRTWWSRLMPFSMMLWPVSVRITICSASLHEGYLCFERTTGLKSGTVHMWSPTAISILSRLVCHHGWTKVHKWRH